LTDDSLSIILERAIKNGVTGMGRTREYDEDAVLTAAMGAFRRRGYSAVSIKDLEQATGLKGGSIYHGYGDKAGLFDAAFTHYNRVVLLGRIAEHAPKAAGLGGVRKLFLTLLHEANDETFGCLITNAAVEFGGSGAAPAGVAEGLRMLSDTFADRLATAHRAGRLRSDVAPGTACMKLLALYQGILVLVRAGWDKAALTAMIDDEFDSLEGKRDDA
jgi:TetR/AcrR family transcriptional regulator, transcriptional repressor for nem operon